MPQESSREDLLALVALLRAERDEAASRSDALVAALRAERDEDRARTERLLVQVGELTAQVQALVLRLGNAWGRQRYGPTSGHGTDTPGT